MDLIIGGAYNSKLDFALQHYELKKSDLENGAECDFDNAFSKKGLYNLHLLIKRMIISNIYDYDNIINKIISSNMDIVICNEVGSGVVPINEIDCKMREYTGKTLALLSNYCSRVIRVYYGIPHIIKG